MQRCKVTLGCLAALKADFGKLPSEIVFDEANWRAWNDSEAPEAREFPAACKDLNLFQRMCVVKCFRADRYTNAILLILVCEKQPSGCPLVSELNGNIDLMR